MLIIYEWIINVFASRNAHLIYLGMNMYIPIGELRKRQFPNSD